MVKQVFLLLPLKNIIIRQKDHSFFPGSYRNKSTLMQYSYTYCTEAVIRCEFLKVRRMACLSTPPAGVTPNSAMKLSSVFSPSPILATSSRNENGKLQAFRSVGVPLHSFQTFGSMDTFTFFIIFPSGKAYYGLVLWVWRGCQIILFYLIINVI